MPPRHKPPVRNLTLDTRRTALHNYAMRENPDEIYLQMVAHYKGCAVCTAAHNCPIGHGLLMRWGQAEQEGAHESWVIIEAERAAARGEPNPYEGSSLPDLGERTP